ncbi:MAG: flagellar biosynthetic protein FliO [Sideroxydans sp. RIFOXYB12_FULL_59_6]|nr:MAG: flagellar biosynthetic protein FliO [Sideroxydans sp. RIFOXYB12_FULL_59_6]
MLTRLFAALLAAIFSPFVYAADAARSAYVPPPPPAGVSSGSVVQVIVSLLLVLAAVMAVAWFLKRINHPSQNGLSALKVISGIAVGQRERIVLVEVNDTWLVVGVAPGQVSALHTMPKGSIPETESTRGSVPERSFQSWLKQHMEKRNG